MNTVPHYRTIRTSKGDFVFSTYFWGVNASGNMVHLSPKRLLDGETHESACKAQLVALKGCYVKATLNKVGIRPSILVYEAKVLPPIMADEKII